MKYSTKFWLVVFFMFFCKLAYWSITPPITKGKGLFIGVLISVYIVASILEAIERSLGDKDYEYSYLKYFNIFWYPYKGVILFNQWLNKQED